MLGRGQPQSFFTYDREYKYKYAPGHKICIIAVYAYCILIYTRNGGKMVCDDFVFVVAYLQIEGSSSMLKLEAIAIRLSTLERECY